MEISDAPSQFGRLQLQPSYVIAVRDYTVWQEMGSPQEPTQRQVDILKEAAELTLLEPCRNMRIKNGSLRLKILMTRHSVSLIRLQWQSLLCGIELPVGKAFYPLFSSSS